VLDYTRRFDHLDVGSMADLELPRSELRHALDRLPAAQRAALEAAAQRVTDYHERQKLESWSFTEADGTRLGQKVTALDRVGLYVPGGKAAYPSSVLMNALPAKVAGVGELIMVVPTPRGEKNALVLAAACLAGVDRVFTIGGAQAVAALAYGTQTMPQVDKIVGPGNAYVAAAKRRVFGTVGIDMVAGPSEVLIIADGSANPDWVAIDLFAQAEHDELAQSILLSPDPGIHRAGGGQHRTPVADHAAPRSDCRLAQGTRRADPGRRPRRGLRNRQPDCAGAPRTGGGRSVAAGGKNPPCRCHLRRPLRLGIAR
jgi:histidinol dehydrogenase